MFVFEIDVLFFIASNFFSLFFFSEGSILQRSLRRSIEEDAKKFALREKELLGEISGLKKQVAEKQKLRAESIDAYHVLEDKIISNGALLEQKVEDYDKLKDGYDRLVRKRDSLLKKAEEKDQTLHAKFNCICELCFAAYDKFSARPEEKC